VGLQSSRSGRFFDLSKSRLRRSSLGIGAVANDRLETGLGQGGNFLS
jgi:hypothetical protein